MGKATKKKATSPLDRKVGVYKHNPKTDGYYCVGSTTLREALTNIDPKDIKKIEAYRKTGDKSIKRGLLAYTPAGNYDDRPRSIKSRLKDTTNQVQLDFDGQKLDEKGLLEKYKWITAIGPSCSGKGGVILVNTKGEDYEGYFRALVEFFEKIEGLKVDKSVSSINELRYVSTGMLTREDPELWEATKVKEFTAIDRIKPSPGSKTLDIPEEFIGKFHYEHLSSYAGRCNSYGVKVEDTIAVLQKKNLFESTSSCYNQPEKIAEYVKRHYEKYAHQFNQARMLLRYDKNGEVEGVNEDAWLDYWIELGYHIYPNEVGFELVHVVNGRAELVQTTHVLKDTILRAIEGKLVTEDESRWITAPPNKIHLPKITADNFLRDSLKDGYIFYKNTVVTFRAGAKKYNLVTYDTLSKLGKLIWKDEVINREFQPLDIGKEQCMYCTFIKNVLIDDSTKHSEEYVKLAYGYALHGYRRPEDDRMPTYMDKAESKLDESSGRTGKGISSHQALMAMVPALLIQGKTWNPEGDFALQGVLLSHRLIIIDDYKGSNFEALYNLACGDITVNRKNLPAFTFPKAYAPKIVITMNTIPDIENDSTRGRILPLLVSDYYKKKHGLNQPIRKEHGIGLLGEEWSEHEWRAFDNFMVDSKQLYFKKGCALPNPEPIFDALINKKVYQDFDELFVKYYEKVAESTTDLSVMQEINDNKELGLRTAQKFLAQLRKLAKLKNHSIVVNQNAQEYMETRMVDGALKVESKRCSGFRIEKSIGAEKIGDTKKSAGKGKRKV